MKVIQNRIIVRIIHRMAQEITARIIQRIIQEIMQGTTARIQAEIAIIQRIIQRITNINNCSGKGLWRNPEPFFQQENKTHIIYYRVGLILKNCG